MIYNNITFDSCSLFFLIIVRVLSLLRTLNNQLISFPSPLLCVFAVILLLCFFRPPAKPRRKPKRKRRKERKPRRRPGRKECRVAFLLRYTHPTHFSSFFTFILYVVLFRAYIKNPSQHIFIFTFILTYFFFLITFYPLFFYLKRTGCDD